MSTSFVLTPFLLSQIDWKEYNKSSVDFIIDFDSTILKFPTQIDSQNYNDDGKISERISERILNEFGRSGKEIIMTLKIIETNPLFTAEEIASKIGKTSRTVENHIQKLKDAGIIVRKGPKLGGFWEVKQN